MNKVEITNTAKIFMCYVGAVIGAGFASGQEIMSFFSRYGKHGIAGLVICGILFASYGYFVLSKIHRKNITTFSGYFADIAGKGTAAIIQEISYGFMFASFCVMVSGSGAVSDELIGTNTPGILFMAILCFVVFVKGVDGMVAVNAIMTPLIIIGILIVGGYALIFDHTAAFSDMTEYVTDNFLVYALVYVSYNTITLIGVLLPLKDNVKSDKIALTASALSGGVLTAMGIVLWAVMGVFGTGINNADVPMLYAAAQISEIMKYIYASVLYMAMITTAVSSGFALISFVRRYANIPPALPAFILCAASVPLAYIGFAELVNKLYSFFGFLGMFVLVLVILDGLRNIKARRTTGLPL